MTEVYNVKEWKRFLKEVKPERKKPVQRESQLQQAAVRWFRYTYPQYKDLLFSIPNAAKRTRVNANRMKAEGQVAGVPDLMLAVPRRTYHGMFIEMKSGKSQPTELQSKIITRLESQHYWVEVCNTLDKFQSTIKVYFSI